jgi:hypothetical protein
MLGARVLEYTHVLVLAGAHVCTWPHTCVTPHAETQGTDTPRLQGAAGRQVHLRR